MKVIALRGNQNSGKSHTINIIYQFLLKEGFRQVNGHFRKLGNPVYEDIIDVLEYKEHKLGIIGMGDYVISDGSLSKLLKELEMKKCDIAVSACRTVPKIEQAVSHYPNHAFVDKSISSNENAHRLVNFIDAESVMKLVKDSLGI